MLNQIVITGRLGKEPELRKTQTGKSVCSISLACDTDFKDEEGNRKTDWIDCVMWNQQADFFCKHFHKGDAASVTGRLQTRRWTDKDGKNRIAMEILVSNVYFAGRHSDSSNTVNEAEATAPAYEELEAQGDLPF